MALPLTRSRPRALTASAMRMGDRNSEYSKRQAMDWQLRTFEYLDRVPEIDFASRVIAQLLTQLRIYPALLDENSKRTPIEEGEPIALLDRIQDPGGGRSQMFDMYGRLMFLTGEGSLFGRDLGVEGRERWSFVWNGELDIQDDGRGGIIKIVHKPGKKEYSPEQAVVYRMWTPHPKDSGQATSPMRAALEIAEELIALTASVRATATTRMTRGMILMPQEISPPPMEPVGDEDPLNDPWISDLADHFEAQVAAAGTAAAAAPFLVSAAYEYLDRIRWLNMHDPQTDYMEQSLRKEAVERLARGFDFPPEILLGLGSSNHWSAKQILDNLWRSHGAPIAERFCDELNNVYLRPALQEQEYPNWNRVVIAYDESKVVVNPDRAGDAFKAHDALAISDHALLTAINMDADDKPSEEELERRIAVKMRDTAFFGGNGNGDTPPPPGPEGDSGRRTRVVASAGVDSAVRELVAAEMALINCRKLAGMRIRQKSMWESLERKCADCVAQANGKSHEQLASVIGAKMLVELGADPMSLVKDGTETYKPLLLSWGYSEAQASALCEMVETYAARTLYQDRTPSLPSGFAAQVIGMKELTGALSH